MPRDCCTASTLRRFRNYFLNACPPVIGWLAFFLIFNSSLRAQEPVRTASTRLPIQSFARSPDAFFYLGPLQAVLIGSAGAQYTDNVNLTATDKISDLSFSQGLSLSNTLVVSPLNQLQFNFAGSLIENFYGNGKQQLNFAIAPDSLIQFQFAVSNFRIRFYDQFSYVQNPTTDPTATNTANLNNLTNTIGTKIDADLNIAILSFSGDYTYNNQSGTTAAGTTNPTTSGERSSFRFGSDLTFRLSPDILYGVTTGVTRSSGTGSANVNSFTAGPFVNGKLSKQFEFNLAAGVNLVDTNPPVDPGYYVTASLRYQIDRHWQLIFSATHDLIFTVGTQLTEENLISLGTELNITRFITFSLSPFVNFGTVETQGGVVPATGSNSGSYTQFGIGAGLSWKFRKRWSTGLTYNYIRRESGATFSTGTTASQNYIQNSLAFSINYAF
jgi:opacity protein-like surface antigen